MTKHSGEERNLHQKGNIAKLVYRPKQHPSQEHPCPVFIILVDQEELPKWEKDSSVPLAMVVSSFDVLVSRTGTITGQMERASHQELCEAFDTIDFTNVFKFMVKHGEIHPIGHHAGLPELQQLYPRQEAMQFER